MGNTTSRLAEDTAIEDAIDLVTVDDNSSVDDGMSVDDDELWPGLIRMDLDSEGNKIPFPDEGIPYHPNLVEYDKDVLEYTEENNHIIQVFEKQFETIVKTGGSVLSGWLWIAAHFGLCKDAGTWDYKNLSPERERELVEEYGEHLLRAADIDVEEVGRVTRTLGNNPIDVSELTAESRRWKHLLREYSRQGFDVEDVIMEFRRFLSNSADTEEATDKLEEMFDNLSAETRLLVIAPELKKFYAEGDTPSTPLTPSTQLRSPYGTRPSGRSLLKALSPTKVRIDGLPEVLRLDEYLEELAASFGPIISVTWIYNEDNRETGSAFMVFEHSSHAIEFQAKYDGLEFDEDDYMLGVSLSWTPPISVTLVTDDDEVNAIDDETNNEKDFTSLKQSIVIDSDDTSSTTSSLPPTVSRISSMPSTPRPIDIAPQSPGPRSPTFSDTFDTLTSTATSRKTKKPASRYRDPRLPRVDPLRYQNRLEEPRRLPKTPTASHWPPAPYSHRGKTPAPRACMTCGRAFRKAKTAAGKKATAGKKTIGGRVKKTVTVVPANKYELRSRK